MYSVESECSLLKDLCETFFNWSRGTAKGNAKALGRGAKGKPAFKGNCFAEESGWPDTRIRFRSFTAKFIIIRGDQFT